MSRPMTLTIAVILQWIAAIISIIGAVGLILGAFATLDSGVRDQIDNALSSEGVTGISAGAITGGVFIAGLVVAAIAVIRVIVAMSLARGHNWARILISVFAILSLLGGIGTLLGGNWLTGIVSIVVEVVILWLLWNASSSAYIKVKTAERAVAG
ncbi:MAG: hypothetical protein ACO3LZ_01725 [Candidatus Nanopelagicales bacterium]